MARYQNSVTLDDTGVVPGSYSSANIVVNSKGQIIAASDGSSGGGGTTGSLDDLFDVNVSSAVPGQILSFNGSVWFSKDLDLDLLTDVAISTPAAGQILYYDGTTWTNGSASSANVLSGGSIGTEVQAQNAKLQTIADMVGTPGLLAFNGTSIAKLSIQPTNDGGLKVTNGNGAASPLTLELDLTNLIINSALSIDDQIVLQDVSSGNPTVATIRDVMAVGGAIVDGQTLGSGADVFVLAQNGIAQFRGIISDSAGIIVDTDADDIRFRLNDSLATLSTATPSLGNMLVGTGTQWASKTMYEVVTGFGFGDIVGSDASDFLAISGGKMAGNIDMDSYTITNLPMPVDNGDAVSKQYVDAQVSAGVTAGEGLVKNGNAISIVSADASITVDADSIQLNQSFTDARYPTSQSLASVAVNDPGALLVGTALKSGLGNAVNVEEALRFINNYFINSLPKFSLDLTAIWNRDVGTPNVGRDSIRDSEVAVFVSEDSSAIYADFVIPANFDTSYPIKFYANVAKSSIDSGTAKFGLSYQYQRPGVSPGNYPNRGPAPNWDFTANDGAELAENDDLLHTLIWTIPANTFQPLDNVTVRLTRLADDPLDTYEDDVYVFSTLIAQ